MKSAQSSTQAFTEIQDVREHIVLLRGGGACIILRVTSVNFALLSGQEQDAKVYAYASLLNSLSFPIQILIRSKPIEISPYLSFIDGLIPKTSNQNLKTYMEKYKNYIGGLVKTSTVLDKQFYVIISYSSLESGAANLVKSGASDNQETFFQQAKTTLETKAESLLSQIHRLSLQAVTLKKDELVKLFYEIYNQGEPFSTTVTDIEKPMVNGQA